MTPKEWKEYVELREFKYELGQKMTEDELKRLCELSHQEREEGKGGQPHGFTEWVKTWTDDEYDRYVRIYQCSLCRYRTEEEGCQGWSSVCIREIMEKEEELRKYRRITLD